MAAGASSGLGRRRFAPNETKKKPPDDSSCPSEKDLAGRHRYNGILGRRRGRRWTGPLPVVTVIALCLLLVGFCLHTIDIPECNDLLCQHYKGKQKGEGSHPDPPAPSHPKLRVETHAMSSNTADTPNAPRSSAVGAAAQPRDGQSREEPPPPPAASPRFCRPAYFWASGKAGSTSLYSVLTYGLREPHTTYASPFAPHGAGKEPCRGEPSDEWDRWEALARSEGVCGSGAAHRPTHILNGCPRRTLPGDAGDILRLHASLAANRTGDALPPAFLMLVRDPVDRLVSHLNDLRRRGENGKALPRLSVEKSVLNLIDLHASEGSRVLETEGLVTRLSLQGLALENLLSATGDPDSVLVIPIESMERDLQGVVDAVSDHVGAARWSLGGVDPPHAGSRAAQRAVRMNNGSTETGRLAYSTLSEKATEGLREVFRDDVLLLERLVGKPFPWSSWAHPGEPHRTGAGGSDWLATAPRGWSPPEDSGRA